MPNLSFTQVDVFSSLPFKGNPLAVIADADHLDEAQMLAIARWTNLSETTFLMQPADSSADYKVRIFTPFGELPFAGHPTLGTCHAWLELGNRAQGARVIQECGVGLVPILAQNQRLAFAAPPLLRQGEPKTALLEQIANGLSIRPSDIRAAQWIDNGAGWLGLYLEDHAQLLGIKPDPEILRGMKLGLVADAPAAMGDDVRFEVRAFVCDDSILEDPVTGSLNAGIATWFFSSGIVKASSYVACQGSQLQRDGRIYLSRTDEAIWVEGATSTRITGTISV